MDTQPVSGESRPAGEPEDAQALTTTSNKSAASAPGEPTEEELQAADSHYDHLKNSGELQRRRDEEAIRYERDSAFTRHLYRTPSEGC